MKDSGHLGTGCRVTSPMTAPCASLGAIRIPLQFLGILKTSLCRSTLEQDGTSAPAAKSYGYWLPLIEQMKFSGFQPDVGWQTQLA